MFNYKINKNINLCNQTTEQVKQKTTIEQKNRIEQMGQKI